MSKGGGKGGSGNSPSGSTTSTQTNAPWSGQIPFLTGGPGAGSGLFNDAANLLVNQPPQYFPTSTVAGLNPTQNNALIQEGNFGINGGPSSLGASNSALTSVENGNFLGADSPIFKNTTDALATSVLPAIDSHFNSDGRFGSGANQYQDTSALSNAVLQNYNGLVGNVLQGAQIAPLTEQAQAAAMGTGLSAGNQVQTQQQNELGDAVNRFNYYQQLPYQQLNEYQGEISGNYGGTSNLTQPFFSQSGKGGSGGKGGSVGSTVASIAPIIAKAALAA